MSRPGCSTTREWGHRVPLLAFLFVFGLGGCSDESEICDDLGCYSCDGMSCRPLTPPKACELNADCERDEYVCRDGACVPDDRTCGGLGCSCAVTGGCDAGFACTAGECRAEDEVCRFDHACGGAQVCVDGRCYAECAGPGDCGAGLVCVEGACQPEAVPCASDAGCEGDLVCIDGGCLAGCSGDGECGADEFCDQGHCRYDDRFTPFCASNGDCQAGHVCVEGLCRTPCENDAACLAFDAQFRFCREGYCQTFDEISSDCHTTVDCSAGEACVNGSCR